MTRNVLLNALGYAAQIVAGLVAVPWLVDALGLVGFGLFSLALAAVGYLGLFDLGFGRALTRLVADRRGRSSEAEIPGLVHSALLTLSLVGLAAAGALMLLGAEAPSRWLGLSGADADALRAAFPWLAACLPFAIGVPALTGVLEGHMRFDVSAAARALGGVSVALGPVLATRIHPSLASAMAGLCVARGTTYLLLALLVLRVVPSLRCGVHFEGRAVSALIRDGGWLTVTNLVGPLMASLDRFAVGRWVSVTSVSYYAAPYEALTRMWAVPDALLGVMFPALAHAADDPQRQRDLVDQSLRVLLIGLVPLVGVAMVFAPELLRLWVGDEMARYGSPVARVLAVGVLINALVRVPFVFLQACGRPDLPARAHLTELVPYLCVLWLACRWGGAVGAAAAWTARIAVDAAVLSTFAVHLRPALARPLVTAAIWAGGALAVVALLGQVPSVVTRALVFAAGTAAWGGVTTAVLLRPDERNVLKRRAIFWL
jgi:O-antigen/teichoic acid export membrane protein